jgi:hypothetical protein
VRLIGYSRKKLDRESDLQSALKAISPVYGNEDFQFDVDADQDPDHAIPFNIERGVERLQTHNCVGFHRKNLVSIAIDNRAYSNRRFIYPHSTVEVVTMESELDMSLKTAEWLTLTKELTETMGLEIAVVLGQRQNTSDYIRTPLNLGIGLIQVFWIMAFGIGYSRLISQPVRETEFFRREGFGSAACQAFISAPTYNVYRSALPELLESQKGEIGYGLFHRLPKMNEESANAGASWLFSPKNILRFASSVLSRTTNYRQYQASVVPEYYRFHA